VGERADVPRVTGGQSKPRIGGKAVPGAPPRRLDVETLPREPGETSGAALARVRSVIGRKLSDFPALQKAWNDARASVLRNNTLRPDNAEELFNKTREAFMRRVRNEKAYPGASKLFRDAGFELPQARSTMPVLANVDPAIPRRETQVSLDHIEEKAQGTGWQKALDANNLRIEFAGPNTEREIKQMRHPELRQ
jgi:hypothetical protein